MRINFESEVPIYLQIKRQVEDAILSGAFLEGTQVPSTTEISTLYKINPATVLKGITLLVDEDVLYKKRGVGMFVQEGAKQRIKETRKGLFYNEFIEELLKEAKQLGISRQELVEMIVKGEEQ